MAGRPAIADSSAQQKAVLGALTKKDANIVRVVDTAAHVALYEFDEVKQVWARGKVEGALHVVERSVDPRYQLVVVNRLSPENRVEDVTPELQIQDQDPYLFYKNRKGETHGIWFYNGQDRERIVSFIEGLDEKEMSVPKAEEPVGAVSESEGDIMRFFARASGNALAAKPPAAMPQAFGLPPPFAAPPQHSVGVPTMLPPAPHPVSAHAPALPPAPHLAHHMLPPHAYMPPMGSAQAHPAHPAASVHSPASAAPYLPHGAPARSAAPAKPAVSRAQLKEALMRLAQDDEFVDMVYAKYTQAP